MVGAAGSRRRSRGHRGRRSSRKIRAGCARTLPMKRAHTRHSGTKRRPQTPSGDVQTSPTGWPG
eukprot:1795492-Prymnesium_polylepis.1